MVYLHRQIRIPIPVPIQTANQMAMSYHATFSTTQSDSDYQIIVMGSESGSELESGSVNVNKPLNGQTHELKMDLKQ